jgi:hypothetical protein
MGSLLIGVGLVLPIFSPALAAPPTNDDFDTPTVIGTLPFTAGPVNTTDATAAGDDPDCAGNDGSVWYAFTPNKTMTIEADTVGSDYNTVLAVFTGTRGSLTPLACDDDYFGTTPGESRIIFNAKAGTTYYFMINLCCSAGGSGGGNLVFNVHQGVFHDVGIVKIERPKTVRDGETRPIKISVRNYGQAETVLVQFFKGSLVAGFELVDVLELPVPAKKTIKFVFNYTFTEQDAALGQIVFSALAIPTSAVFDDRFADNIFVSQPVKVKYSKNSSVSAAELADELIEEEDTVSNPDFPNPVLLPRAVENRVFLPVVIQQN